VVDPKKQIPIITTSSGGTALQNGYPTILNYRAVAGWLMPNDGPLGYTNGSIAVSANGEVYVTHRLPMAGIAVYAPDGTCLRNVPNAPRNLHKIFIRTEPEGEVLYGVRGGGAGILGPIVVGSDRTNHREDDVGRGSPVEYLGFRHPGSV
jgi:hypothetical protein